MAIKKNRDRTFRFSPISFEDYVALHAEANRDENERAFRQRLKEAVEAKRAGQLCECGEPIWAIGSAAAHYACFTCIGLNRFAVGPSAVRLRFVRTIAGGALPGDNIHRMGSGAPSRTVQTRSPYNDSNPFDSMPIKQLSCQTYRFSPIRF
jgi:hypothetical protein